MCSYVGFALKNKDVLRSDDNIRYLKGLFQKIPKLLKVKGGDEYKTVIRIGDFTTQYDTCEFTDEKINKLINFMKSDNDLVVSFAFFSRLTPEMELTGTNRNQKNSQPYINEINDSIIMVHGTIPKAEEMDKRAEVDTDLFLYHEPKAVIDYVTKVDGKISMLEITKYGIIKWFDNGLGCYSNEYGPFTIYTNINLPIADYIQKKLKSDFNYNPYKTNRYKLLALFSGGLDITCSLQRYFFDLPNKSSLDEIELLYFDWGTRASKKEIEAGLKFKKIYSKKLIDSGWKGIKFKHTIIDVTNMFKNILSGVGLTTTRLIDNDATGAGTHEAEAAISYVPFRNQFLITMAAAYAEQHNPNDKVDIILGGNLSEGMVYLDTSETFLNNINKTIKVGGQKSINFNVVAPYINRTKTHIVKDAIFHRFNLETAYSCYFPKEDGSECMECGSCLLKHEALKRGQNG